jgi:hypothetical protein
MKIKPIKTKTSDGITLSLTIGKEYEVLGIEADDFRILDDPDSEPYGNDPVLFSPDCFEVTDDTKPSFWICSVGDDGERYCYPPEWDGIGFFEDYHDGVEEVRKQFWEGLRRYYPTTWQERVAKK